MYVVVQVLWVCPCGTYTCIGSTLVAILYIRPGTFLSPFRFPQGQLCPDEHGVRGDGRLVSVQPPLRSCPHQGPRRGFASRTVALQLQEKRASRIFDLLHLVAAGAGSIG